MSKKNILIIEDEKPIREMVRFSFFNSDFILDEAEDVNQAREKILAHPPDLILLDWMLPGMNGVDFAKELRSKNTLGIDSEAVKIPIIMLTAKSEEKDKIKGLNAGMDDYVVKPFSTKELIARIHAVLRRSSDAQLDTVKIGHLELNEESQRVTCSGKQVSLGPLEFKLLSYFMHHPERVYSRSQILDRVWGGDVYVEERTVDVHIRRLRKVLAEHKQANLVQTIRGSGYRFSAKE
ncbi:MAG: phosphate regulon transcriptional regulator PhoB [gamma proteobacterium symbiont of Bathyaustriella thionipta]|nr:phosphate regulon transcriptional regulator PhoB [gamma proteobacterium symbiont of Bathyaustriella thionipta]MCU7949361.1 phosphate regulon transcriptional regulator PhoB [gamma proteobacterium symbiont of Bathyaustriella thionipta]MCU7954676.1 phosphate regulon transcriptional regulator PhoB [gamma proteobacterium symbiont of Bathyaustriella thionipta]MCU7955960.1 phosphate regulon transcriptional regulator PhoB [gamma proteobacterium symbiont of Bathyaustriella thionipta]MCU7968182.1 phos